MSQKYRFDDRIGELLRQVDHGRQLEGTVVMDQAYAQLQHEDLSFFHPRGGQAKYLEEPLLGKHKTYLRDVARSVLKDGGATGMAQAMERLSGDAEDRAPIEFGDLRNSGHPIVKSGSNTIYDRAPRRDRLTEAELEAKDARRGGVA